MNTTDIMIHIDADLDARQREELENQLRDLQGVIAPRFNKPHLLVVLYDAGSVQAANLLRAVTTRGLKAQLVAI